VIGLRYGFICSSSPSHVLLGLVLELLQARHLSDGAAISPMVDGVWPPAGIETFDPWHLPLINTLILLCSGCAATWAHHALVHENNRKDMSTGLMARHRAGRALHHVPDLRIQPRGLSALPATSMAPTSSWRRASTASMW
jgi:hypothetical protein